jgi:hypothetical protein
MQRDYIRLFKGLGDKRCCEVCPSTSRLRFQTSKGKSPGPSQSLSREQIQLVVGLMSGADRISFSEDCAERRMREVHRLRNVMYTGGMQILRYDTCKSPFY